MKQFGVRMIDNSISSQWWKGIMNHFVKIGMYLKFVVGKKKLPRLKVLLCMAQLLMINTKYLSKVP